MRHTSPVIVGLGLCLALGWPQISAAQPASRPTIHRVTVRPDSGVLTITGTGLGPDFFVSVDGHPVATLPGASDTQVEVMAPATVLSMPGTYRLTVVDSTRQVGDAFVVATSGASVLPATGPAPGESSGGAPPEAVAQQGARRAAPAKRAASDPRPVGPNLFEGANNTAAGNLALASNTTGVYNTAIGAWSLMSNTQGSDNTATGAMALTSNTTGRSNTAFGDFAGSHATTGSYNVYLGASVSGTAADTNTIRIGLPYESGYGTGQNRTFIAGIHGAQLAGPTYQVVVDANGQLGTLTPPVQLSGGATATPLSVLQQQVERQQATIAAQQANIAAQQTTIDGLLAGLARLEAASRAAWRQ
jgi:hypothetical protein